MKIDIAQSSAQIDALERKPSNVSSQREASYLHNLIEDQSVAKRLEQYADPIIVGIGGSGIILRATYTPSGGYRALKFPRHAHYERASNDPHTVEPDPERAALEKVSHQNITRLYDAFELPNGTSHCMITEYIDRSTSLDTYVIEIFCDSRSKQSGERLAAALKNLARMIYEIASAMEYLHTEVKLLHFDIKPENILVSPKGVPYVTDLGFARDIRNTGEQDIEVGFTWKYAHPRLQDPHRGALVTNVPQKAKTPLRPNELSPIFDIFAFGRTLQELLAIIYIEYGESIHAQYAYDYLHVVASLCLDKRNGSFAAPKSRGEFVSDTALGMPPSVYARSSFASFSQVKICMERLVGLRRFEDELEEIDRWYGSTIKISETGSTTLTPRVANIINHPALQRLKRERQLGMLDSVFPGATHSRFQHTLGTYHAATLYLAALYYDPENPLFRALVEIESCKALLVAMLVHDIGQTAYGHELEEIDEDEFGHGQYVECILKSKSFCDRRGYTLQDVIERDDDGCWALPINKVYRLFSRPETNSSPFQGIMHDILDSPIDADKFDYLVRDSVEARVTYGHGIDLDRFLRSLTTHVGTDGTLRLAVKQKGSASAESFAHARYQLYQSMYWHHTFRATKAMLLDAIQRIQSELRSKGEPDIFDLHPFRTAYTRHVLGATDYHPNAESKREQSPHRTSGRSAKKPTISELIDRRMGGTSSDLPIRYREDEFIKFLYRLAGDPKSSALINDLVNRNYYKRLLEISPNSITTPRWEVLRRRFTKDRLGIEQAVERELLNALRTKVQSEAGRRQTLEADPTLRQISDIVAEKVPFLVDIPLRGWFGSDEAPPYVSDYKRRHFRAGSADRGFERREAFWINMLGDSMKSAAYIRFFCEPRLHSIVLSIMTANDVYAAVAAAIPEIAPQT